MSGHASMSGPSDDLDLDVLHERYSAERLKRLRQDGVDQYQKAEGDHAGFLDDPFTPQLRPRDALVARKKVLIIGAGFGGLLTAVRLQQSGIEDFLIVDRAGDVGGTWYWNRYPGAACDIESYVYIPLLEELGSLPSRKYAPGAEIFDFARKIADRFGLYPRALFQTSVTDMTWNEGEACWDVATDRGDRISAQFVCSSPGPYPRLKFPGVPGITGFEGRAFHTSRWDYAYTGGAPGDDRLGKLADKRVAVIGTGATAIQCIPPLARSAGHLTVFQRTPSAVDVREDAETPADFAASLKPGWQKERMDNFTACISGAPVEVDMVDDAWSRSLARLGRYLADDPETVRLRQIEDYRKMNEIRQRIDEVVTDPATAEALKPWYNYMCKRPCFHDGYLDVFNRANVTLVETGGHGVERITAGGVVAGGVEHAVDCIVFATGFEFLSDGKGRVGFEVTGRNGELLSEHWTRGLSTLHGLHMRHFPNFFILGNVQQGATANFTAMHDELSKHLAYVIRQAEDRGIRFMEATPAAEAEWVDKVMSFAAVRRRFQQDCTPGYLNNEGYLDDLAIRNGFFGGGLRMYHKLLADWREDGSLAGLDLHRAEAAAAQD